ncbi:MAG: hypothetical protein Kow0088_00610 [Anaerolineales bacterium]
MKLPTKLILIGLLGFFLAGCVRLYDPESSHEWHTDIVYVLQSNELASQTIYLSQESLSKISLWVTPTETTAPDTTVTLSIIDLNQAPKFLLSIPQSLNSCPSQPCSFSIPPELYLPAGKYAIVLESSAPISLRGSQLDSYPQGNFSLNNQSTSADLGFTLEYRYTFQSFLVDLVRIGKGVWIVFPIVAFLITPGLIFLKLIHFPFPRDRSVSFYLILSTSLALIPIGLAWTTALNIHWRAIPLRFLFYGCFLWVVWVAMRNWRQWTAHFRLDDFLLWLVFSLAFFIRLIMSRNLVAPAWVDSVHHALITQLILKNGSYPISYEPFMTITTTSYHSGFHADLAIFTWLSNLTLPTSMLLFGQLLNTLAVYSAYAFTISFYPKRSTGIIAAALVAFLSPMPAYYTSWGRYTQLGGLIILPAIIYLFQRRISTRTSRLSPAIYPSLLVISLLFSGLIIIHYRVSYFITILLGLSSLVKIFYSPSSYRKTNLIRLAIYIGAIGLLTLLLSSTWLPDALKTSLIPKFTAWNQPPTTPEALPINLLTPAYGKIILALAGFGLALEIVRRSWSGILIFLWVLILYATIYLTYLASRAVGFLNMTSVTISLYLPLSALAAQGTTSILKWIKRRIRLKWRSLQIILSVLAITLTAAIGSQRLIPLLNPITMLVRSDDLKAMDFIRSNLESEHKFLIQPFLWGYGLYAGNDGGSWIPALTEHPTIPPPVIFALTSSSAQIHQINQVSQRVLENPNDALHIAKLMQENGLKYLYLGARGGSISPSAVSRSPYFKQIYHQGRVFIFELLAPQNYP